MLKHLRRWHFDLALFLGLAIFSWAYWYSKPRPVWTKVYPTDNYEVKHSFRFLGYSADSQSIYTTHESNVLRNNWSTPQIQRWSTQTGEMLEDYPVELPEEDRFLLQLPKPNLFLQQPKLIVGSSYTITLSKDPRYFMLRYHQSKQKDHHYLRLYHINGKPIGQGLEVPRYFQVECIPDPSDKDRHWMLSFDLRVKSKELLVTITDFDTGKTVRVIQSPARTDLDTFPTLSGGRYLVIKKKTKEAETKNTELIDIQSGESIGQLNTPAGRANDLVPLNETHWAVCTMIGDFNNFFTRLDIFRYDPNTKTFEPDSLHPLNGITTGQNEWILLKPPQMILISQDVIKHNDSQVMKTILGWLARIGISRDETIKNHYRIADLVTGQPLRQISGLIPYIDTTNADFRFVAEITCGPNDQPGLCLYLIPHYLWETTLSWMQWLSWLLVIPWPLRYFVQPHLAPGSSSWGKPSLT